MKTKEKLRQTLRQHYLFEDFQVEDFSFGKTIKELDIDSISLVELFLVIEEAFGLHGELSSRVDLEEAKEETLDGLMDLLVIEIDKALQDTQE
jgi:acyl carrier protein